MPSLTHPYATIPNPARAALLASAGQAGPPLPFGMLPPGGSLGTIVGPGGQVMQLQMSMDQIQLQVEFIPLIHIHIDASPTDVHGSTGAVPNFQASLEVEGLLLTVEGKEGALYTALLCAAQYLCLVHLSSCPWSSVLLDFRGQSLELDGRSRSGPDLPPWVRC